MAASPSRLLLGVLGAPIAHSASPVMQEAALQALGLPGRYLALEVEPAHLSEAVAGLHALGFSGANLTAPLKEAVLPFLRRIDPLAARLGAVNTLVRTSHRGARSGFLGLNTDLPALEEALAKVWPRNGGRSALVVGAGGAAATTLVVLARAGVRVCWLLARTPRRGRALAGRLREARLLRRMEVNVIVPGGSLPPCEVVVNATPLGRRGRRLPIDRRALRETTVVVDWVYRAGGTALSMLAHERGLACVGGETLLLEQGARALSHWIGRPLPLRARRAMALALARHLDLSEPFS